MKLIEPKLKMVREVAAIFGRRELWVREHEKMGDFRWPDGTRIEPIRKVSAKGNLGSRYYTLDMIEAMALSLKKQYKINKYEHERIMNLVKAFRNITQH